MTGVQTCALPISARDRICIGTRCADVVDHEMIVQLRIDHMIVYSVYFALLFEHHLHIVVVR